MEPDQSQEEQEVLEGEKNPDRGDSSRNDPGDSEQVVPDHQSAGRGAVERQARR